MNSGTLNNAVIGATIRKARRNHRLTQDQLAKAIDVTPAFVGHIERGDRSLSLETLIKVAQRLNISLDSLFLGKDFSKDEEVLNDFRQLMTGKSEAVQQTVIDVVRTLINHIE